MSGIRRQRRSSHEWHALVTRFASSGQTVAAFCRGEAISAASFYRWRSLLGAAAGAGDGPVTGALPLAPTRFVDLGPLITPPASSLTFELHLELGGGLLLHLVRR